VTQRMCRWLVTAADRAHTDDLPYTHSLIAHMVGTRRQTVTETISRLQKANIILNKRSSVHIVNRREMELTACHCYVEMKRLYQLLVAPAF